jgi:hypothetical protein
MKIYFGIVGSGASLMPKSLPIRLRLPVVTCFPGTEIEEFQKLGPDPSSTRGRDARVGGSRRAAIDSAERLGIDLALRTVEDGLRLAPD